MTAGKLQQIPRAVRSTRRGRARQRGVTLFGLLFWALLIGFGAYLVIRVFPTVNEYLTIKSAVEKIAAAQPATVAEVRRPENNHVLKIAVPAPWMRYVFAKGYIAVNGASLTVAEAQRNADGSGWFEVWLIPETLRMTTFGEKAEGAEVHIEIERQTQVFVDTVRAAIDERLGPLLPALEKLLQQQGSTLDDMARPAALPRS